MRLSHALLAGALLAIGEAAPAPVLAAATAGQAGSDYAAAQAAFLEALAPDQGWRATPSGLRYRRLAGDGRGPHPTTADVVRLRYSVRFTDGRELENSGPRPVDLPLGRLIPGWQEGVPLMAVGDRFEFAIPAALAYGPNDNGPIPGGSTLLFTIDLLAINPRP